jgi:Protein of unknown function (DUF2946)
MARRTWLDCCTRWTTLVALVLATLAPSVAHALRAERGPVLSWQRICSATGAMRVVPVDDNGAPMRAHAFEQCLTCLLHHGAAAPPPMPPRPLAVEAAALTLPPLLRQTPPPRADWRVAQPRAPPARA